MPHPARPEAMLTVEEPRPSLGPVIRAAGAGTPRPSGRGRTVFVSGLSHPCVRFHWIHSGFFCRPCVLGNKPRVGQGRGDPGKSV